MNRLAHIALGQSMASMVCGLFSGSASAILGRGRGGAAPSGRHEIARRIAPGMLPAKESKPCRGGRWVRVHSTLFCPMSPLQGLGFFGGFYPGCYPGLSHLALSGHRRKEATAQ